MNEQREWTVTDRETLELLDRLGSAERSAAPPGMEDRLASAGAEAAACGHGLRLVGGERRRVTGALTWGLRAAAAVALVAGVGIALTRPWSVGPGGGPAGAGVASGVVQQLERDLELALWMKRGDDGLAGLEADLAALDLATDFATETIGGSGEWWSEALSEGSM